MNATLPDSRHRPYPHHMQTGVAWIGPIPREWNLSRLKYVAKVIMGQSPASEDYNTSGEGLPFLQGNADFGLVSPSPRVYCATAAKTAPVNAILLSVRAPVGALNIANQFYGIGRGLCAVIPDEITVSMQFAWYLLAVVCEELQTQATGSTYEAVSVQEVLDLTVVLPSMEEQQAIAAFLDRETARIDALIAKKQRLIELLQEKRSAIISHAVIGGVDPLVKKGASGIDWLGELPAHWKVCSLRWITLSKCDGPFGSGLKSEHYQESGVRVVRLQNIGNGEFQDEDRAFIGVDYYNTLGDHSVVPGDVLIAGLGDDAHPVGRACVAPAHLGPAMVKADCSRFRVDAARANPEFIALFLTSAAQLTPGRDCTGTTRQRMNLSTTAGRPVALPPIEEQHAIVDWIRVGTARIAELLRPIEAGLEKLREYRSALISAAVTGKIDVRTKNWEESIPSFEQSLTEEGRDATVYRGG